MKTINIGIVGIEQRERNTKGILSIIQKNNILKNITHTLTLLSSSKLTADFMFYKYNLDIFIIESAMDISIFIRNLKNSTIRLDCKRVSKSFFSRNSNQILFSLLYKVIEFEDFYIYTRNDTGYFRIYFNEISFIEVSERATIIHTIDNEVVTYKSLKKYNDLLDYRFARCHASYLVNLDYIRLISYPDIYLINGEQILISKHKRHDFMEYYSYYISENINKTLCLSL
ncbi:MAG: LytR/AlgR family response regulator transcription factor [Lachnotalea sp.]